MPNLAVLCLAFLAAPQDELPPQWLLVRSTTPWEGALNWERVESAYLGNVRSVSLGAEDAHLHRSANRLVVGRPDDNALVAELAARLGLEWGDAALGFQGNEYGPGKGLVIVVDDPDGGGLVALYTGFDQAGVFSGFTSSTQITKRGYTVIDNGRKLDAGAVQLAPRPVIVRLDRDYERLMEDTRDWPGPARNLRVARAFVGFAHVYSQLTGQSDLLPLVRDVLVPGAADIEFASEFFAGRDLDAELLSAFELCRTKLGPLEGAQPIYYVLHHTRDATNARSFGADPFTGARQILFNLPALARAKHWESAIVHETIHAWQKDFGETLAERAIADGVACAVAGALCPKLSHADIMLWTPEELAAADANRAAILTAFRAVATSKDRALHAEFMLKDRPLSNVPGAPSRTGYYVGWLACRNWLAQHPDAPLVTLLQTPAAEVLAALD